MHQVTTNKKVMYLLLVFVSLLGIFISLVNLNIINWDVFGLRNRISPQQSNPLTPSITQSPNLTSSLGTITGRLCFPSEVLPEGVIEAKRLSDNQIFSQNYPGSQNGGGIIYSFQLQPGNYYLRYRTNLGLSGYSTTVCANGNESTCRDTNQRILNTAEVIPNEITQNNNLCDFYYQSNNAPQF